MARITVTGMFDRTEDAADARRDIESLGVPQEDIGFLVNRADDQDPVEDESSNAGAGASTGAGLGTLLGGGAGLLTGLGVMAIPGVGPIVAAGWLATTLAGAVAGAVAGGAAGGLVGAMTHAGVDEDAAQVYAEGVRRGGTVLTVQAEDERRGEIEQVLLENGAIDAIARGEAYRSAGWQRYDPDAPPYTPDEITRERDLYPRDVPRV
jgi:hypothetical protein